MNALEQGFRLEEVFVDPTTGAVSGPGGREQLDAKVMAVLVFVARNAGQVVPRETLLAELWPGVVVTDDALTRCFYELRRQLSRAGGDTKYRNLIETLPKRGYRLRGTVLPAGPSPQNKLPSALKRNRALVAGGVAVTLLMAVAAAFFFVTKARDASAPSLPSQRHAIVVLPFLDMSEKEDHGYLADGVTEEILNRLSQSKDLRVIARTSSFALRDKALDVPQIAAKLDVSHVIEGSVRRSGGRVRVTAQLIDASTNAHIWSQTYDRGLGDLFAIQDDIASSVATALEATTGGAESRGREPKSIEAYERYLRGQVVYNRRGPNDIQQSVQYFEEAVTLDPGYARAWAALSGAYSLLVHHGHMPAEQGLPLQRDAALRAVELDPRLAVAQNRLARYYFNVGDRAKAREHSRIAQELDPDDPLVLGGQAGVAARRGNYETAVTLLRRAVARDPLSSLLRHNLASDLAAAGRYDEALVEMRAAKEIDPAESAEMDCQIAQMHVLLGQFEQAESVVAKMAPDNCRDRALALLYKLPGHREAADAAFARVVDRAAREPGAAAAEIYAYRGLHEQAIESLEAARKSLQEMPGLAPEVSFRFENDLRMSPFLAPLRKDPRLRALMDDRYGFSTLLPVVRRASRSRCACAASAKG
ncbi:MAG: winged helix-turn-helix domain-containing tetratricopeptide repeat protein [Steroidobacteraceae bacterium]